MPSSANWRSVFCFLGLWLSLIFGRGHHVKGMFFSENAETGFLHLQYSKWQVLSANIKIYAIEHNRTLSFLSLPAMQFKYHQGQGLLIYEIKLITSKIWPLKSALGLFVALGDGRGKVTYDIVKISTNVQRSYFS